MSPTRRDFLRRGACVLGGAALASTVENFGFVNALAQTQSAASDYKALVCVFLNGGNDGNNMVVPLDAEFAAYNSVRAASGLGFAQTSLLPINPARGRQFGLHPSMTELKTLFEQQRLAVLCNTGPLVEPLTRSTYLSGSGRRPYQLFSHSDQVAQWQNSIASAPVQTGWGGRTADRTGALNGAASFPQVVSVGGVSLFITGTNARALVISDARTGLDRVLPLNNPPGSSGYTTAETAARRTAFDQLRGLDRSMLLVKASSDTTSQAIQTSQALGTNPTINTRFPNSPDNVTGLTSFAAQLLQIAKVIALRDTLGIKRQIFFCGLGSFDHHANQRGAAANTQDGLLLQLSQALKAFYDATVELGVASSVTTFTISDFGRTFQPAGSGAPVGTDHAWGNHQLVMGGAVRGGDFYGTFPTLALGGPDDADTRGRWIPTTAIEQYAATLATWYGLSTSDLPYVFPLLDRFATPNLGFLA